MSSTAGQASSDARRPRLAYAALVLALRVTGKRTLAMLSAFDLLVMVALGSTLSTVLLSKLVAIVKEITPS